MSAALKAADCGTEPEGAPVFLNVRPDNARTLRYLGIRGAEPDEGTAERLSRAEELCAEGGARGLFRVFAIGARDAEGVHLEGSALVLSGEHIARHLEGASSAALLVATLGLGNERLIRRETAFFATDGMLVDAASSSMAEEAVRALHEHVRRWAAERGLRVGTRFSPGYGDLPLEVQPAFLDAVGAGKTLGVSTTPANLLVPSKSVTAVVGLF